MFTGDCLPWHNICIVQHVGSSYHTHGASWSKRNFLENSILRGFVKKNQFLIFPRICSQKIKDSQSRLKNSSIFMVSSPRSQEKRWLTLPHFLLPQFWRFDLKRPPMTLFRPESARLSAFERCLHEFPKFSPFFSKLFVSRLPDTSFEVCWQIGLPL